MACVELEPAVAMHHRNLAETLLRLQDWAAARAHAEARAQPGDDEQGEGRRRVLPLPPAARRLTLAGADRRLGRRIGARAIGAARARAVTRAGTDRATRLPHRGWTG